MTSSVVIADDHPVFLHGVRTVIDAAPDFEVIGEAGDAQETVRIALELQPKLVVLDMTMPDFSGIEATYRIKKSAPQIKILILSMHTEPRYVCGGLKAGANGYLLKDSAHGELVNALKFILQGSIYLSPVIAFLGKSAFDSNLASLKDPMRRLTTREREVLIGIALGETTKGIGRKLNLSPKTIATHREHLMQKTGRHTAVDLTRYAISVGLIPTDELGHHCRSD